MQKITVAIDGPSGSGKSSVSKEAARRLGAAYLDTGAMYRAVTWHALDAGTDLTDAAAVAAAVKAADLFISTDPDVEKVTIHGADVTEAIREPFVSAAVSAVATNLEARAELVARQRAIIAAHPRIVAEGRDITTVVAPDAEARILLTASEEARLRRRGLQLGGTQSAAELEAQVLARDAKDSTVVNFQVAADGVVTVDSSDLDFEQTVATVLEAIKAQAA
ncbi:(d)CMP kinase [Paeniglutamicibacter psychrophenolicus]|uniref:(d)CMP kinase n=1 Tax=Paeniglutamicibacter psychrophenolicus TaxID=257454 RepID=UPI0027851C2C|nr:(d)CMP kinase [Paeniglutamicibacter psychrophenolicus]MDQ0095373.1 cytidylate kinase [Paeniglutamicibacter psychrophenolicus]